MKKGLLFKSGCVIATLLFSATSTLGASEYDGDMYDVLSAARQERGAMGPIRSDETVKIETSVAAQYDGDMYDKFRLPSKELRGAMGPIRSDEPSKEDTFWKDLQQRAPVLGGGNG